jgi:hypothetical protein
VKVGKKYHLLKSVWQADASMGRQVSRRRRSRGQRRVSELDRELGRVKQEAKY